MSTVNNESKLFNICFLRDWKQEYEVSLLTNMHFMFKIINQFKMPIYQNNGKKVCMCLTKNNPSVSKAHLCKIFAKIALLAIILIKHNSFYNGNLL